jgi:hypothetical protein
MPWELVGTVTGVSGCPVCDYDKFDLEPGEDLVLATL